MIDKILADEVLLKAVSGGADFAEIFCELTRTNVVSLVDKKIDKINDNVISGVGIRAFYGTQTVYASTCLWVSNTWFRGSHCFVSLQCSQ